MGVLFIWFIRLDIQPLSTTQTKKVGLSSEALSELSSQIGDLAVTQIFETMDPREIRHWAKHLTNSYPRLLDSEHQLSELTKFESAPEIGPLGAVAIGFAAGAAARIIGKNMESVDAVSAEAFPLVVAAFLAGAAAGARAVDGKL